MKRRLQHWGPIVALLFSAANAVEASGVARQFSSGSTTEHPVLLAIGHGVLLILGISVVIALFSRSTIPGSDR